MRGLPVLLCALYVIAATLNTQADDAASLLAKHKAFVGWQFGDGTFKTLSIDSERVKTGTDAVDRKYHTVHIGAVYRETFESAEGSRDNGFTGNIFWSSNVNGFPRPVRGAVANYIVSEEILFNEATTLLPGEARGTASVEGKTVSLVRVKPPHGDIIDLAIDSSSGAYVMARIDPGGPYERTIDILEYGDAVPGKKIIAKWKYRDSDYLRRNTKVLANVQVTNDDLHPPAERATWDFRNPHPFKIIFSDKDLDPRIIVDAKVNGVPGRFILDTGASNIFLSRAFADKARVKRIFKTNFSGLTGDLKGEMAHADTIEVGANILHNVIVGAGGEAMDSEAPDGLLGFDLMGGAIVAVDLDSQTMTIFDPKRNQVDRSLGIALAADLSDGVPYIPMTVDGVIQVNALLDSGAGTYVLYSPQLVHHGVRMLIDDTSLAAHLPFSGVSGNYDIGDCGNLEKISFGSIVYEHAPACQVRRAVSDREIIVGLDFLKGFNLLFDYPDSYLVLIPRNKP